jgi:hypothetical protein
MDEEFYSSFEPLMNHGILRERFAALLTDSVRAACLELAGYKTDVCEFIDLENTPKNIMLRAVKRKNTPDLTDKINDFEATVAQYGIKPMLYELMKGAI